MKKANPVAQPLDHAGQVVVGVGAQRAGAEAQAVRGGGDAVEQRGEVRLGTGDAGETEQRKGRIVGMEDEADAERIGVRAHRAQKGDVILAQAIGIDAGIILHRGQKARGGEAFLAARQAGEDRRLQRVAVRRRQPREQRGGGGDAGRRVIGLGTGAAEDVDVVGGDGIPFEPQRERAIGHEVSEVRPRPVEQGHEIIGDDGDATGGKIGQAVAIGGDAVFPQGPPRLDDIIHRQAFDHGPAKARRLDHRAARGDGVARPDRAVGNLVQRGHHLAGAGLPDRGERDRVGRAEPAHRLRHPRGRGPIMRRRHPPFSRQTHHRAGL